MNQNRKVMAYTKLIVEKQDNICTVKINNPEALNALNSTILKELDAAFTAIGEDDSVDVVILTGEGRSFVAGADISQMSTLNAVEGKAFGELGAAVFRKIELLNKVVIAGVNGFALGGGCELAMACDIRIASVKAKFGQPEVGLGITPGFSGTQRLPRIVGLGKAKELIYTGRIITAEEAKLIGLVNQVTGDTREELMEAAKAMAEQIMKKGPVATRLAKMAINVGMDTDINTGLLFERIAQTVAFGTEDRKEGTQAFLEKRKAEFKGC